MVALVKTDNRILNTIIQGDCLTVLATLDDCSIDSIVTDPPAGINFMGKDFDKDRGGRNQWIAWLAEIMREALRCLKPGGHAFVWALPRTSHWTATAIEDAGFEIREKCYHLFGSGFPKSKSLGNGIGSALKPAVEEWILARKPLSERSLEANHARWGTGGLNIDATRIQSTNYEPNARQHKTTLGTTCEDDIYAGGWKGTGKGWNGTQGRFPSNLLLSHSVWCIPIGTKRVPSHGHFPRSAESGGIWGNGKSPKLVPESNNGYAGASNTEEVEAWECHESCPIAELDRQSGVRKSGGRITQDYETPTYGATPFSRSKDFQMERSEGGASRYFSQFSPDVPVPYRYISKASRAERNKGCEGLPEGYNDFQRETCGLSRANGDKDGSKGTRSNPQSNHHPTVKPVSLMKWLVRLVCPPGGIVLDPFCGSGSTLVAAIHEGVHFIGIEQDEAYCAIARSRILYAYEEVGKSCQ